RSARSIRSNNPSIVKAYGSRGWPAERPIESRRATGIPPRTSRMAGGENGQKQRIAMRTRQSEMPRDRQAARRTCTSRRSEARGALIAPTVLDGGGEVALGGRG